MQQARQPYICMHVVDRIARRSICLSSLSRSLCANPAVFSFMDLTSTPWLLAPRKHVSAPWSMAPRSWRDVGRGGDLAPTWTSLGAIDLGTEFGAVDLGAELLLYRS